MSAALSGWGAFAQTVLVHPARNAVVINNMAHFFMFFIGFLLKIIIY